MDSWGRLLGTWETSYPADWRAGRLAATVSSSTRNLVQVSRPGGAAISFTPGAVLHGICGLVVPHPPTSTVNRSLQNRVPLNTDYVPGILYALLQATIAGTWEVLV